MELFINFTEFFAPVELFFTFKFFHLCGDVLQLYIFYFCGAVFHICSFSLMWLGFSLLQFFLISVELFFTFTVICFCGAVFQFTKFFTSVDLFLNLQSFSLLWSWFTLSS